MRTLKIAAIAAALVLVPVVAVQAYTGKGPSFSCDHWQELATNVNILAITNNSVTYRTTGDGATVVLSVGPNRKPVKVTTWGPDARTPILRSDALVANPNQSLSSIYGSKGIVIRRDYTNTNHLSVWTCKTS